MNELELAAEYKTLDKTQAKARRRQITIMRALSEKFSARKVGVLLGLSHVTVIKTLERHDG
jgi:hypothetical protein